MITSKVDISPVNRISKCLAKVMIMDSAELVFPFYHMSSLQACLLDINATYT